jgi:hypothetical protein
MTAPVWWKPGKHYAECTRAVQRCLDDRPSVALSMADWSVLEGRTTVTVLNDRLADSDAVVARLLPFALSPSFA